MEIIFSIISAIIPLPINVEELIFLIFVIRLADIDISRFLAKFSISLINSLDLYIGSPFLDGCTIKLMSLFLILIVLPPYTHL